MGVVGNIEAIIQTTGGSIDNNIFIGTAWEGKIFKSSDGGASWTQVVDLAGVAEIDALIQAANGDLYAGTHCVAPDEARIYRSTDYGATWSVVAAPSIDGELSGMTVIEWIIQASTGYFYATGLPGHVWRSDNGDTWVKVADKSILGGAYKNYSMFETCNGYIYVATRSPGGVWRSTDNGNTWTQVADSTELGGGVTRCDGLRQASDGTIYVGTDTGKIYRSTDGDNWVFEASLAGAGRVNAIIEAAPGHMYAGTSYNGDVFTVYHAPPEAPELVSPENCSDIFDTTPTFVWTSVEDPNGLTYQIQIDDDIDFSSPVYSAIGLTENTHTLPSENALELFVHYWWRVRVKYNTCSTGPWSEEWHFHVVPISAIGAIIIPLLLLLPLVLVLRRQNERYRY
jgi:photosystem II stability/assembly factor-like uncharacterized protein